MKINLVKKSDNDEEKDLVEEEDDDDGSKSHGVLDGDAKKKMIRFMIITVGVILLLIIILNLFASFGRSYSYDQIESIMEKAARSYFSDYPTSLPSNDGGVVEVDSANLVAAGKMKDLSSYTKKDVVCTGNVRVEKSGNEYLYLPFLNCGDSYVSLELYKKVLEDNSTVTSGYGLYSSKNGYVFKGELVNNYVQLDNSMWRIVKINSNNEVVMILNNTVWSTHPWDNRYNEEKSFSSGHNEYSTSRIKEYLEKIYTNPDKKNKEEILSAHDKARLASMDLCIGKRGKESTYKDNTEECKKKYQNQKLGLLTVSDFLNASVDPSCKSILTKSCKNYNYLVLNSSWWLLTAFSENSYNVYVVNDSGVVTISNASSFSRVRPVIALGNFVKYKEGKGTLEEPYLIK